MNKDELPDDVADWPHVCHWLRGLTLQHRESGKSGPFPSKSLAHVAGKSIVHELAGHQHALGCYSSTRNASRPKLPDLANRFESGLRSCTPEPPDSQTSGRIPRHTTHLRASTQRVCAPNFVTHRVNRRQCCVADKRKQKRMCAELDGAYP